MSLDRARQLRSSLPANVAGGTDPVRLRVDAVGDLMKLLGERVVVNARQASISIQVVPLSAPSSGSSTTTSSPGIGLHLFAWHYDSLSPRAELQALAQHLHVELGAELLADSSDPERLYTQERGLLDAHRLLPLVLLPEYVGIAPTVRNWTVAPSGEWRLADVWIDSGEPPASSSEETSGSNAASGVHP
jgi:hypothetical protein